MKQRLEQRAIWIFDEYFLLPGLLSVCSFYEYSNIPGTIYYCEEDVPESLETLISECSVDVKVQSIMKGKEYSDREDYKTIVNRLVRMEVMKNHEDEIVYLFDADLIFADSIKELESHCIKEITQHDVRILGHIETQIAHHNYLYFKSSCTKSYEYKLSDLQKHDLYTACFGAEWPQLLGSPGYNNGVLIFYKCAELSESWESYYRKGLEESQINASDDQLPLIAACNQLVIKRGSIDKAFNSLGDLYQAHVIYHAFSNSWKSQIYNAVTQEFPKSKYTAEVIKHKDKIPASLFIEFVDNYNHQEMGWYHALAGHCNYRHLLKDIISSMDEGRIIEVGTSSGKSLTFASELITKSNKSILVESIYHQESGWTLDEYLELMNHLESTRAGKIIQYHNSINSVNCPEESIDLVFINSSSDQNDLYRLIDHFYDALKPGGLLAGYDYGAQDGINFGDGAPSFEFAKSHGLDIRHDFDIFLIQKPSVNQQIRNKETALSILKNIVK